MTDSVESVLQKSREEFEKWYVSDARNFYDNQVSWHSYDQNIAWHSWQASRSALEPILAELTEAQKIIIIQRELLDHWSDTFNVREWRKEVSDACVSELVEKTSGREPDKFDDAWFSSHDYGTGMEKAHDMTHAYLDRKGVPRDGKGLYLRIDSILERAEAAQALSPSPTPAQDYQAFAAEMAAYDCEPSLELDKDQKKARTAKPSPDSATPQKVTLTEAVDAARKEWQTVHGACSMCALGDVAIDGFHRGKYACGATTGKGEQG